MKNKTSTENNIEVINKPSKSFDKCFRKILQDNISDKREHELLCDNLKSILRRMIFFGTAKKHKLNFFSVNKITNISDLDFTLLIVNCSLFFL